MTLYEKAVFIVKVLKEFGYNETYIGRMSVETTYRRHQRKQLLDILNTLDEKYLSHIDLHLYLQDKGKVTRMKVTRIQNKPITISYYK